MKLQQETKALEDFRKAVSTAPLDWEYKLSLAELLQVLGFHSEATNYYRDLVGQRQLDEPILIGLARCLQDTSELEEAKRTLEFLIGMQPQSEKALIELSRLALRQRDPATGRSCPSRRMGAKRSFDCSSKSRGELCPITLFERTGQA